MLSFAAFHIYRKRSHQSSAHVYWRLCACEREGAMASTSMLCTMLYMEKRHWLCGGPMEWKQQNRSSAYVRLQNNSVLSSQRVWPSGERMPEPCASHDFHSSCHFESMATVENIILLLHREFWNRNMHKEESIFVSFELILYISYSNIRPNIVNIMNNPFIMKCQTFASFERWLGDWHDDYLQPSNADSIELLETFPWKYIE